MPRLTRGMVFIVIFMILITSALLFLNSSRESENLEDLPLPIVTARPRQDTLTRTLRLTGITKSRSLVTVLPRIGGVLVALDAAMGDSVQEGQILGKIDPEAYELNLAQAQAALSGAEATYRRVEVLFKSNSVPRQSFDETLAAYEAAKAQHALAALNREWADIRSPIKGTVMVEHAERGALVSPQVPIVTIADLERPELSLEVPEVYYGSFQIRGCSLKVLLTVPALNHEDFICRVSTIAPWISPESKTFETKLLIEDPEHLIRPGMFASVFIELESVKDVAVLDWSTLSSDGGLWYLEEGGIPHRMDYTPQVKGDEGFQAPTGMESAEFITQGQHFLTEGVPVRIVEP